MSFRLEMLQVALPKGFAFISSNVAAQLTTTADGRLKLAFANPSGQANPVTIHARKTTAAFPPAKFEDMFFDDVKTLYDLAAPETGRIAVEQIYSDYRKGKMATLDSVMTYQDVSRQLRERHPEKLFITGEDRFLGYSLRRGARGPHGCGDRRRRVVEPGV